MLWFMTFSHNVVCFLSFIRVSILSIFCVMFFCSGLPPAFYKYTTSLLLFVWSICLFINMISEFNSVAYWHVVCVALRDATDRYQLI